MDARTTDQIKVRLYKEFYENNKLLYKRNPFEYYMKQDEHVTRKLREEIHLLERKLKDE